MRSFLRLQVAVCCVTLGLSGCSRCGRDPGARGPGPALAAVSDKPAVLAELPDDRSPELLFSDRGGGVAYVLEEGGKYRVVHNGRAGKKAYDAVANVVLSPDGRRCAFGARVDGKWRMVVDGTEGKSFGNVASPVFSADGEHLAYQAQVDASWRLVVDDIENARTKTRYGMHAFSGDSSRIVYVDEVDDAGVGRLVVSDLRFEKPTVIDARVSNAVLNAEASRVAAVAASDHGQLVLTFATGAPGDVKRGPAHDAVYNVAFGPDGGSLAYLAVKSGQYVLVLDDREMPMAAGEEIISLPAIRPDGRGLAAMVITNGAVTLRQYFVERAAEGAYQSAEGLLYDRDGGAHAYAAQRGDAWFVVTNGNEGPPFDRVVDPVFSPDGQYLVYRARKGGKRFVVVAQATGAVIRQLPEYEQVFPVRFTADGKAIAYGVKDGRRLAWKVERL
ncbi:TolB family protein [Anaeromyxobacter oryzae]|uniref:Uncharacterized protein n=1 Tax=Anaeromyxobacter oryzae TaxID=2918170 RepID=A0ABN6N4G8_9BACT|nr:hypothetical protein [Anaeromyxobacter oryzae]BDG06854.1 hypothetical protein AMOR_58500 [Anaeromyxobacter oryzae]